MQILAIDLGTETLPALALGREPPSPGSWTGRRADAAESVISGRCCSGPGCSSASSRAALVMAGFFYVLLEAGWSPGDPTGEGTPLHHAYLQATTMTFLGIVACQVGTAFAARTERASLRSVGVLSNRLLLWGIAFELRFAALLVYAPPFQSAARHRRARPRTCCCSSRRSRSSSGAPTRSGAG